MALMRALQWTPSWYVWADNLVPFYGQPLDQVWRVAGPKGIMVLAQRHMKRGLVHFEALIEGVLMAPLDPRYTQVGFNLISVQVWILLTFLVLLGRVPTYKHWQSRVLASCWLDVQKPERKLRPPFCSECPHIGFWATVPNLIVISSLTCIRHIAFAYGSNRSIPYCDLWIHFKILL